MTVSPLNRTLEATLRQQIGQQTSKTGTLGRIEDLAIQVALIQQTTAPELTNPHILVFAGDHGLSDEKGSATPAETTYQRVQQFIAGEALMPVLCEQNDMRLLLCDVGVAGTFAENTPEFVKFKVSAGTRNLLHEPAMTPDECAAAMDAGRTLVDGVAYRDCNLVGFGAMGVGNELSASLLMHRLTGLSLDQCLERSTGLADADPEQILLMLQKAADQYPHLTNPEDVLAALGGLEIAAVAGGMLQAAQNGMVILVDGFVSTVALLVAKSLEPNVLDYCIFTQQSAEPGHRLLLEQLGGQPLLNLDLCLGGGAGCALAYPLIRSAVALLRFTA